MVDKPHCGTATVSEIRPEGRMLLHRQCPPLDSSKSGVNWVDDNST